MRLKGRWLAAIPLGHSASAAAHGFGQRYDLPVPLWLYVAGAGATVAVSFAMVAWFMRRVPARQQIDRLRPAVPLDGAVGRGILALARLVTLLVYLLVIAAGFLGSQNALNNIAPAMVWAIWWVGFAYVSALIGNVWTLVNPLVTIWSWVERHFTPPRRDLPRALGVWPAVILFVAFNWIELAWDRSDVPANVAALVVGYSALTWFAMAVYGRRWLEHGEVFTIVFGVLARFAPLEFGAGERITVIVRPYGAGLLTSRPLPASMTVLVLTMLAAVTFDGFSETPAWAAIVEAFGGDASGAREIAVTTFGLLSAPLLFVAAYFAVCQAIRRLGGASGTLRVAGSFVLTLVPIAIAYHLSHYLSLLAMAAQYLIPLASDPFGWDWDLFGGGTWFLRPVLIDARLLWFVSVAAIVAGHVAAIYVAHRQALAEFESARSALRSQLPMLVLMVGYTMSSLWIIAQPIVSDR